MLKPPHAARIWTEGPRLWLEIPSAVGGHPHSIHLPQTPEGLALALSIITARSRSSEPAKIANAGAETQWQVERALVKDFLANSKPKKKSKFSNEQLDKVKMVCKELGLL